jgi:hypothetical protein
MIKRYLYGGLRTDNRHGNFVPDPYVVPWRRARCRALLLKRSIALVHVSSPYTASPHPTELLNLYPTLISESLSKLRGRSATASDSRHRFIDSDPKRMTAHACTSQPFALTIRSSTMKSMPRFGIQWLCAVDNSGS